MKPTSSNFKQHMVVCPQSIGGVLVGFVMAGRGSSEWRRNQANPLDVAVHGETVAPLGGTCVCLDGPISMFLVALDSSGPDLLIGAITKVIGS